LNFYRSANTYQEDVFMPTAIVTGASRGFGFALASALAHQGWSLVVDARDAQHLSEAVARIGTGRLTPVAGDVTDSTHRSRLVAAAEGLGGLDLLVHNASELGPSPQPPLATYPLATLRRVYEVNVVAPLALTQEAAATLDRSPAPAVVMLSSDAAVEAYEGWGGYGSSKAALDHVAAVLAVEQPSWRVYAFDPGDMNTAMHQAAFPGEDISDRADPATVVPRLLELLAARPASGRYRAADQVAVVA
jgi:NAD(P)-dependent dehydrogenase (short-subunit alcohol dehydrogenase family)